MHLKKSDVCTVGVRLILSFLLVTVLFVGARPVVAVDADDVLVKRFAPSLFFAFGELFFPTSVSYHLENADLKRDGRIVDSKPSMASIAAFTDVRANYYLESRLVSSDRIAIDYARARERFGTPIYVRVARDSSSGTQLIVLEYWFFYAYNNGPLNDHQGDWEMISVFLDPSGQAKLAGYSQHFRGEVARWEDVEKSDGTHPNVYVAKGSHASYFRSYQGNFGFEADQVGGGEQIGWSKLSLEILVDPRSGRPPSGQLWLLFAGRWGEYGTEENMLRGEQGPLGPLYNLNGQKWLQAGAWAAGLRNVDTYWFIANWAVTNCLLLLVVVTAALSAVFGWNLVKRWKSGELAVVNWRGSKMMVGLVIWSVGVIVVVLGVFLPWYQVSIDVSGGPYRTGGFVDVLIIDGVRGFTVNVLGRGKGLTSLFGFTTPLGAFVVAGLFVGLVAFLGAETPVIMKRAGMMRGIVAFVPIVVILVFVASLGSIIPAVVSAAGVNEATNAILQISNSLITNPLGGTVVRNFGDYGSSQLVWKLGYGSYCFLAGGVVMIIGAMLVGQSTVSTPSLARRAAVEREFCINCGARLPADAAFCENCGASTRSQRGE